MAEFDPNNGHGVITAEYVTAELQEYAGNPLVEALPPFRSAEHLMEKFGRFPHIEEAERELSATTRMLCVSRLDTYLEPMPSHLEVIDQTGLLIYGGYAHRNPVRPEYAKTLVHFYRQSMGGEICPIEWSGPSTAKSFSLFGVSGGGKSTVLERTLSFYPQAIHHPQHGFTQLVWLKIDCPLDGSLKQLLLSIVDRIDQKLGTKHMKEVGRGVAIDGLILHVAKIAARHHLGVLVVDEIQNLLDAPGIGPAKMLNFFVTFANEVKIPFIVLGTPKAKTMLEPLFRNARRLSAAGSYDWDRMRQDDEWEYFLTELWRFQWTRKPTQMTAAVLKAMYHETQGIRSLVVKLFQLSQIQAIRDESEKISIALIEKVAAEKFTLLTPALEALRSGNKEKIKKYEDLLSGAISNVTSQSADASKLEQIKAEQLKKKQHNDRRVRLISNLIHVGLDPKDARFLVDVLLDAKVDRDELRGKISAVIEADRSGDRTRNLLTAFRTARANGDDIMAAIAATGIFGSEGGAGA
jgi:hypothetical protein